MLFSRLKGDQRKGCELQQLGIASHLSTPCLPDDGSDQKLEVGLAWEQGCWTDSGLEIIACMVCMLAHR